MIVSVQRLVFGSLLAAGFVLAAGCDRGPGRPPVDTSALVGNWIELADQAKANPRVRGAEKERKREYRYIVLKADNTFELSVRSAKGEPTKDTGKIEGTWEVTADNTITFKATSNTFADGSERRDWAPESSIGVSKRESPDHTTIDVMTIVDVEGAVTAFRPAS